MVSSARIVCLVKRMTVPEGRKCGDAIWRERERALRKEEGKEGRKETRGGCGPITTT